jgi:hypothetical protein
VAVVQEHTTVQVLLEVQEVEAEAVNIMVHKTVKPVLPI